MVDAKLSVVIPVYNETNTICEILRRVQETEMRKEIVVVDDCSKDGTREFLQGLAELQEKGESQAASTDGGDPIELRDMRFLFPRDESGKGRGIAPRICGGHRRHCAGAGCRPGI